MKVDFAGSAPSLLGALELYHANIMALRADVLAAGEKVDALAADLIGLRIAAEAAEERAASATAALEALRAEHKAATEASAREITIAAPVAEPATDAMAEDDLTLVAGIDTVAADTLNGFGIGNFASLARLDEDEAAAIGMVLGDVDRISRESWVDQASILAAGGFTTYARMRLDGGSEPAESPFPEPPVEIEEIAAATTAPQEIAETVEISTEPIASAAIEADTAEDTTEAEIRPVLEVIEPVTTEAVAAETTEAPVAAAASSNVVSFPAARARKRRPLAIAASLAVLLAGSVVLGMSADQFGLSLQALSNCGEAVMLGDTTCIRLPASML